MALPSPRHKTPPLFEMPLSGHDEAGHERMLVGSSLDYTRFYVPVGLVLHLSNARRDTLTQHESSLWRVTQALLEGANQLQCRLKLNCAVAHDREMPPAHHARTDCKPADTRFPSFTISDACTQRPLHTVLINANPAPPANAW
jgi:hypothetical protein